MVEVFKEAIVDLVFPIELREIKLVAFMNLRQGGMSVNEYSLKFTQLSKYAPIGVFILVQKECLNENAP